MSLSGESDVQKFFSFAAGIAGNVFAFVLFASPITTSKRIIVSKSTEDFSGLPYIYALLNCLICMWYGFPWVSRGVILVATVNSVGAVFQMVYVVIFIIHTGRNKKINMCGLLLGVFALFGLVVYVSLSCFDPPMRQIFVGYLSIASLISMFASPLFVITKSVEFMPFYLSLSIFLMSISFFVYGMLKCDFFIYIPNGIGAILGMVQLLLYAHYSKASRNDARLHLLA